MPKLLSIGFAVPQEHILTQDDVLGLVGYKSASAALIFHSAGVSKRHFAMDPTKYSWQELRELCRPLSLKLSLEAVESCLDNKWKPTDFGMLVFSSVTDYNTPALGYYIARSLGMNQDIEFINVEGQGCQSAIPGLKRACDYYQVHHRPVLVVNTEVCSTTYYPGSEVDLENVVTNALFADASVAAIVGDDLSPRHPYLIDFQSLYDPRYLDLLGFTWVDGRLKCRLDKSVPKVIPPLIKEAVYRLLVRNSLRISDIRYWAIHPGGPAILERIQSLLGLSRTDVAASWETLSEYGNCSSATLALIAKRMQSQLQAPVGYGVGVTMGAGGSIEACLFYYTLKTEEKRVPVRVPARVTQAQEQERPYEYARPSP